MKKKLLRGFFIILTMFNQASAQTTTVVNRTNHNISVAFIAWGCGGQSQGWTRVCNREEVKPKASVSYKWRPLQSGKRVGVNLQGEVYRIPQSEITASFGLGLLGVAAQSASTYKPQAHKTNLPYDHYKTKNIKNTIYITNPFPGNDVRWEKK